MKKVILFAICILPIFSFGQDQQDENAYLKMYDPVMLEGSFTAMLHNPTNCLLTAEVHFGKEVQTIPLEPGIYYRVQFWNWPQNKITAKVLDKCQSVRGDNKRLKLELKTFFNTQK